MNWHKKHKDPHFKREQSKYEHPIPSREYIMTWLEHRGGPATYKQLVKELHLSSEEECDAFSHRLKAMTRDGQLMRNRKEGYGLIDKMDLVRGRILGHPDGFGFLIPDDGKDDIFLTERQMRTVLHGDRVLVRIAGENRRGRKEGAIVEVLERANDEVVGRFFEEAGAKFIVPDNKRISQDILIANGDDLSAKHGQIVVAEIVTQPTWRNPPIGQVREILGDHLYPGMEIDVAIRTHGVSHEWPDKVVEEVGRLPSNVGKKDIRDRKDIRKLPLVTIDGADARDFDDAVYCEPLPKGGWKLFVAIADVSHYVKPKSALDTEATHRGNSVYFPEHVVPMLPEALSNGLCSLNPKVDRLCMVCEMNVNAVGRVTRSQFYPAVMHSHARLTYEQVNGMLEGSLPVGDDMANLFEHLVHLHDLYKVLHAQRAQRGALEFDSTETRIVFGEDKKIQSIEEVVRNDAHRMIEECMLCANVSAARFLQKQEMPTLYRVHSGPEPQKINDLRSFLHEMGLKLGGGKKPRPKIFCELLEQIADRPEAHLIQTLLLRSLNQAVYSPKVSGHFGLAYPIYTHFTSPIRRYPDLLVHRAIKHILQKGTPENFYYAHGQMEKLGEHCSMTERRADEATRDAIYALKCEYMINRVGEIFKGTVSGVTGFGFFVELDDIYVDGLVHVSGLDSDYYHFDPIRQRLRGERTGREFHLGDRVTVRVAKVDLDDKKIDLECVD